MSGIFGGGNKTSTSTVKLPGYLDKASKKLINKATALTENAKFVPYKGDMVAGSNSYISKAGTTLNHQDDLSRENFSQADRLLDGIDRGQQTYNTVDKLYDKGHAGFQNRMDSALTDINEARGLGKATDQATDIYGGMVKGLEGSQQQAKDIQLGTGKQVRDTLTGALTGSGKGFDEASDMIRKAAALDGTNTDAITARMNPYADLVTKKNLDNWEKSRSIGATQNADAARAAGAFGGSRHGIVEGMYNKDTGEGFQDISNKGNYDAFNSAIGQLNTDRDSLIKSGTSLSGIQTSRDNSTLGLTGALSDSAQKDAELARQLGLDTLKAKDMSAGGLMGAEKQKYDFATGTAKMLQDQAGLTSSEALANANARLGAQNQKFGQTLNLADAQATLGQADQTSRQKKAADLLGYGKEQRSMEQQRLDARRNEFDRKQDFNKDNLSFLSSILNGVPYSKTSTQTEPGQSLGNALISAGGTIVGGMLSDKNAKTGRKPTEGEDVLESFAKMPVDHYRYKDDVVAQGAPSGQRIGTMAQDFAREFGGDGKTIDFAQATGAMMAGIKALEERTRGTLPKRKPRRTAA